MQNDRRACIFVVVIFLAVIVAPGLYQTVAELWQDEKPGALDVFKQPPTAENLHAYEQSLEDSSLVVKELRPLAQYLEWKFLADPGEKAVVARDGWLFYRPNLRYLLDRNIDDSDSSGSPLAAIRSFRDELLASGIRLLVVPVPSKESIYPEMLANRAEHARVIVAESTRRLLEELKQESIEYLDLFEVFERAKQEAGQAHLGRLYLKNDTHWSPSGARLAAATVAKRMLGSGIVNRGAGNYVERPISVKRLGDLVEMLQAPDIERAIEPESVACMQVVETDKPLDHRDRPDSQVMILGDSFLRIYEYDEPGAAGFIAHLARELAQPLSSIVNDGGGSTLVRQELARRAARLANKKLVIWEFAERDIRFGTLGWQIVPLNRTLVQPR